MANSPCWDGQLAGDGTLAGYLLPLHRALIGTAAAAHQAVNPPADTPEAIFGTVPLTRRRAG